MIRPQRVNPMKTRQTSKNTKRMPASCWLSIAVIGLAVNSLAPCVGKAESAAAAALATSSREPASKPNILFILVDDYGIKDVGIEGSTFYETPNIDSLARSGMRFTQGYAACQVCSPSRASILLGKYPARHGITNWLGGDSGGGENAKIFTPDYLRALPADDTTLAEALKEAGYATFFAGKWHLGNKGSSPEDHGFEINKGGSYRGGPHHGYFPPYQLPNLPDGPKGEELSQRLATETIAFMEQNQNKPFLAYLSFYAVHAPIQTTRPLWSKYRDKASQLPMPVERFKIDRTLPVRQVQDNPIYAGLVESMDAAVGRVLTRLKELGLDERTIVCFTSDNGGVSSGHDYGSCNLPYRGGKGRQWEGGLRVPFYLRAPGITTAGSRCDTPVIGTDFFPTILQLAGLPLRPQQHIDGVSLEPLMRGGQITPRPLFWHYPHYGMQGGEPSSIIRLGNWKLIHYWEDHRNELYNLAEDIGEECDLAAKEVEQTGLLWAQLQAWLKETGTRIPQVNPAYKPAKDTQDAQEFRIQAKLQAKARLEAEHAAYLDSDWKPDPTWWRSLVPKD